MIILAPAPAGVTFLKQQYEDHFSGYWQTT